LIACKDTFAREPRQRGHNEYEERRSQKIIPGDAAETSRKLNIELESFVAGRSPFPD
jgi:hypothetical protein